MAAELLVCYEMRCDRCGQPARVGQEERPAHWGSIECAVEHLSGPGWGWLASRSTQVCAACCAVVVCLNTGHDWGQWSSPGVLAWEGHQVRVCDRCGVDEIRATADHALHAVGGEQDG